MSPLYQLVVAEIDMSPPPLPPGDHTLLTLAQAATLPELGGHVDQRALWREVDRFRLQTTFRLGRHYTTRAWVDDWISNGCQDLSSRHALSTKTTEGLGRSATRRSPAAAAASASLEARLSRLTGSSRNSS